MANNNVNRYRRADTDKVARLARRLDTLYEEAQQAAAGRGSGLAGGVRSAAGQLLGAGAPERENPLGPIVQALDDARAELAAIWDLRDTLVDGLRAMDAADEAVLPLTAAWDPARMALPEGGAPAETGPVVLWPDTGGEWPALHEALAQSGLRVIMVHPTAAAGEGMAAPAALAAYRGRPVGIVCTSPAAAPFVDAFAQKQLLVCRPEGMPPEAEGVQAALEALADEVCTGPDTAAAAAARLARLCRERRTLADLVVLAAEDETAADGREQQLARHAATAGRRVLYIETTPAEGKTRLEEKRGGLYRLRLAATPGAATTLAPAAEARAHFRREVEKVLAELGVEHGILKVDHPLWGEAAFTLRRSRRLPVLYDCMGDWAATGSAKALRSAERSLLAGADFVVSASSELAARAGNKGPRSLTVRNGCDAAHFAAAPPPQREEGQPAVLGCWGAPGRLNLEVLRALEESSLPVEVHLLGADEAAQKALAGCRKLRFLPAPPYAELPAAVAGFTLCLLPLSSKDPAVRVSSPPAFYEALAAGRAVVGTAVPELMVFRGRYAQLEDDPGWFLRRVRECLDGISTLVGPEERVSFARQNDWAARAEAFEEVYRKLELARGRAVRGDVWAEQSARGEGEAPLFALPAPARKNAAEQMLSTQLAAALEANAELTALLQAKDENLRRALAATEEMMGAKSHRLAGTLGRLRSELVHGSAEEKKASLAWMAGRRELSEEEKRRHQPLFTVQGLLQDNLALSEARALDAFSAPAGGGVPELPEPYTQCDILLFAQLAWAQRRQRPQQLARAAAEAGHRVFYLQPAFTSAPKVELCGERLYVVSLPGEPGASVFDGPPPPALESALEALVWHFGVRDALSLVAYPHWAGSALRLRERHGFKLVADCPSDFTGFYTPGTESGEQNGMLLLQEADAVVPCSEPLAGIARQVRGGDHPIVRNGCDHPHFAAALGIEKPAPAPAKQGEAPAPPRPQIGYVGLVSHWFDADAVCRLAEALPEADILLAGPVQEWEARLRAQPNIRLLGEVPYEELPALLASFDAALIPFDTEGDYAAAADPVKFWEYLAAGRKVVASRLPALRHYEGEYALLYDDAEGLIAAVKQCLAGEDGLPGAEALSAFAAQNSWAQRWREYWALAAAAVPLVSIIVPTLNSEAAVRHCIQSVLSQTAYPRYELLVADRGSGDGTRATLDALLHEEVPGLRAVYTEAGTGWAAAVNEAERQAEGQYICLLEDGARVTRGWLTALTGHLEADAKLGAVGPSTNLGAGEAKVPVFYRSTAELQRFAYLFTGRRQGQLRTRVTALHFFCCLLRREGLQKAGGLDEAYTSRTLPAYDWARQLKSQKLALAVAEDAFVHREADDPAPAALSEEEREAFAADRARYEEKWNAKWKPQGHRSGVGKEQNRSLPPLDTEEAQPAAEGGSADAV